MKKYILLLLLLFSIIPGVFSVTPEQTQDDVDIVDFVDCPIYKPSCTFKKWLLSGAYDNQEESLLAFENMFNSINKLETENFSPEILALNLFVLDIISYLLLFWFFKIMLSSQSTGGNLHKINRLEESINNFIKVCLLFFFVAIFILFIHDFFYQINKYYIYSFDYKSLILIDYNHISQGLSSFIFNSWFISWCVVLINLMSYFVKLLLFLSSPLIIISSFLYFTRFKRYFYFIRDYLVFAYLFTPFIIIYLELSTIAFISEIGFYANGFIFLILMFIVFGIFFIIIPLRFMFKIFGEQISDRIVEGFQTTASLNSAYGKREKRNLNQLSKKNKYEILQKDKTIKNMSRGFDTELKQKNKEIKVLSKHK